MLGHELDRQVDREPVGVVQQKRVGGGDPLGAGQPRALDQLVEALQALLERPAEALLLGLEPLLDRVALLAELTVLGAHDLGDAVGVDAQEARVELERAALLDRAAHDAAQDVAAILVRRDHAVGDQERHRARVVGEQTQRSVGRILLAVAPAAHLLPQLDQRPELVGLEYRGLALNDRSQAVEPQAGVDVLRGQRRQLVHRVLVELHEHEIPVLEEALVVAARKVVGLAELEAAVEIQLRARPARSGRAGLPEVLGPRALDDPLARDPDLEPGLDRFLIGAEPELVVARQTR